MNIIIVVLTGVSIALTIGIITQRVALGKLERDLRNHKRLQDGRLDRLREQQQDNYRLLIDKRALEIKREEAELYNQYNERLNELKSRKSK